MRVRVGAEAPQKQFGGSRMPFPPAGSQAAGFEVWAEKVGEARLESSLGLLTASATATSQGPSVHRSDVYAWAVTQACR